MTYAGVSANLVLGVLNLFPLPPLDGGRILAALLPPKRVDRAVAHRAVRFHHRAAAGHDRRADELLAASARECRSWP
jgi:Zn-dependent protease